MEASRLKLNTPRLAVHGSRFNNSRNKYDSDNNNDDDDTKHLWQCDGQAELSLVDGYIDGAGLETLSVEMVQAELAAIRREQNTAGTELSRASTPQPSAMQGGRAHQ